MIRVAMISRRCGRVNSTPGSFRVGDSPYPYAVRGFGGAKNFRARFAKLRLVDLIAVPRGVKRRWDEDAH